MTEPQKYQVWQNAELSKTFLEGVRGAIPLAAEQIDCLLRLIQLTQTKVDKFIDLGCGNGILGKAILQLYPEAQGFFIDISETMLDAAKNSLNNSHKSVHFILEDFGKKQWLKSLENQAPFDVIVSGFSIHHQPNKRKKEIYQEIYELLKPAGIFLNLEHIASKSKLGEDAFDQLFVDSLYSYHKNQGSNQSREEIAKQYYNRHDKNANILESLTCQCQWLEEIGFVDVDCYFKLFEIALFGGRK